MPVGNYVTLPPGEPADAAFAEWGREGRVPAGSVLAEFVGTLDSPSGYRGLKDLSGRRVAVVVRQPAGRNVPGRLFAVLAPGGV